MKFAKTFLIRAGLITFLILIPQAFKYSIFILDDYCFSKGGFYFLLFALIASMTTIGFASIYLVKETKIFKRTCAFFYALYLGYMIGILLIESAMALGESCP